MTLLLCIAVLAELLIGTLVEWGSGYVEMAFLDNLRHEAVKKRHDKCVDVRTIDIGIGHDDQLMISCL